MQCFAVIMSYFKNSNILGAMERRRIRANRIKVGENCAAQQDRDFNLADYSISLSAIWLLSDQRSTYEQSESVHLWTRFILIHSLNSAIPLIAIRVTVLKTAHSSQSGDGWEQVKKNGNG